MSTWRRPDERCAQRGRGLSRRATTAPSNRARRAELRTRPPRRPREHVSPAKLQEGVVVRRSSLRETVPLAPALSATEELLVTHDLVLSGGRVLDPETGLDRRCDVGIDAWRVTAVGDALDGSATIDVSGLAVAPGFIDLHSH